MYLSEDDTYKFIELYKRKFNKTLSYKEAQEEFSKLLELTKAIYKPMSKEGFTKLEKRRKELGILPKLENEKE